MNLFTTPAIVINNYSLREADELLCIITREMGRISAIARHSRKSNKRFMGGLDLFDCGTFELSKPAVSSRPYTIISAQKQSYWPELRNDLNKFSSACCCLELCQQMTADDDIDSKELFNPLFKCLRAISTAKSKEQVLTIVAYFNLKLLQTSGYSIIENWEEANKNLETCNWLSQMLLTDRPIIPHKLGLLRTGLFSLLKHSQEISGKEIQSARSINF